MTASTNPRDGAARAVEAVVFDLYGTLLALDDPLLRRRVPQVLGVPGRRWLELVRRDLLTTAFPDTRRLSEFVCRTLRADAGPELVEACTRAIEEELASVRVVDGVMSLLHFLKQRGIRLGLVSNASSAHKLPFERCGLASLFDAACFSCDEGRTKPDPALYRGVCRRLGVAERNTLMVGDSLANDVRAPAALGMMTALVDPRAGVGGMRSAAEIAWWALAGEEPERPLLRLGQRFALGGAAWVVTALRPVSEGAQGRYNLVYEVEARGEGEEARGRPARVLFAKRYMFPDSARLEALAYGIQGCAGLPTCEACVVEGGEPFLLVSRADGAKYEGELDCATAYELGRHFAFGYIFSNADLRPRNAFRAVREDGGVGITMVDLEHCFFNLAIDVAGLPDPSTPGAIDALGAPALERLTKKRVLTEKTLPRARNEFFDVRTAPPEVTRAYGEGFLAAYRELGRRAEEICALIAARIAERPYLVIGTRGYRRAMAEFDLADIRARLAADPGPVLERLLATRG